MRRAPTSEPAPRVGREPKLDVVGSIVGTGRGLEDDVEPSRWEGEEAESLGHGGGEVRCGVRANRGQFMRRFAQLDGQFASPGLHRRDGLRVALDLADPVPRLIRELHDVGERFAVLAAKIDQLLTTGPEHREAFRIRYRGLERYTSIVGYIRGVCLQPAKARLERSRRRPAGEGDDRVTECIDRGIDE